MSRESRKKSASGIYHIIMRGINRQSIFEDNDDYDKFIKTLQQYKLISKYNVYAYCLMGNHIHILLKVGKEPLEQIMRRICGSYVYRYNRKYERIGNLFQDRFKSEPVDNDTYFLKLIRYIHQNPVIAGLVTSAEKYNWSSYNEYLIKEKFVDVKYVFDLLNTEKDKSLRIFIKYINEENNDVCLENGEDHFLKDEEAKRIIKEFCNVNNAIDLQRLDKTTRNIYLKGLKEIHGLSVRQIERLTGINRGIVLRA